MSGTEEKEKHTLLLKNKQTNKKKLGIIIYALPFRQQVLTDWLTGLIFLAQDMSNSY